MGKGAHFVVDRAFNNNVVLVTEPSTQNEIILLGRGIGFGQKKGNLIAADDPRIEKKFRMDNAAHVKQYQRLVNEVDQAVIGISEEIIALIAKEIAPQLNQYVHVALPDHIHFAIYRLKNGMEIVNPFLYEVKSLYPKEFALAKKAANMIADTFHIEIPESEVGFLTLHIHSAVSNLPVSKAVQYTTIVADLVGIIEQRLGIEMERDGMDYIRLAAHLRAVVERVRLQKTVANPLLEKIREAVPEAYLLARDLGKIIAERLNAHVPEDEIGFIAMHLFRLMQSAEHR
jgi:transcriptional antiterminator